MAYSWMVSYFVKFLTGDFTVGMTGEETGAVFGNSWQNQKRRRYLTSFFVYSFKSI